MKKVLTPSGTAEKSTRIITTTSKVNSKDCKKLLQQKVAEFEKAVPNKLDIASRYIIQTPQIQPQTEQGLSLKRSESTNQNPPRVNPSNSISSDVKNEILLLQNYKVQVNELRMLLMQQIQLRKLNQKSFQQRLNELNIEATKKTQDIVKQSLTSIKKQISEIQQFRKQISQQLLSYSTIQVPQLIRRQLNTTKNEFKLQVGQLRQCLSSLFAQIKQITSQIHNKPSVNDIQEYFNEIKQKLVSTSTSNQQLYSVLCQVKDDNDEIAIKMKDMQGCLNKLTVTVQNNDGEIRDLFDETIGNLQQSIQDKLTKIISSYNANFAQIEENSLDLKQMVSEILNINSLLSQKLITLVTNKLDSMTFQSTIENINSKIHESFSVNNKKISQIGDKQFQFQHQLRSLKEILDNLKSDYEKNYNKLRSFEDRSMNDSDVKSSVDSRLQINTNNFNCNTNCVVLSPKTYDINFDFVKFKRTQQRERKSFAQKKGGRNHNVINNTNNINLQNNNGQNSYNSNENNGNHSKQEICRKQHNNLADELAELQF